MLARSRTSRLAAMLLGLLLCLFAAARGAQAAPYSSAPTLSVSVTNPCQQATLTVAGAGFQPGTVTIRVGGDVVTTTQVGADGLLQVDIMLPDGATGRTTVVATGADAADSASAVLTINAACTAGETLNQGGGSSSPPRAGLDGGSGDAGLSSTGVAVASLLVVALGLVVGGTVLLLGARRRAARTTE